MKNLILRAFLVIFPANISYSSIIKTKTSCEETEKKLVYYCLVQITNNGKPAPNSIATVGADMPSMPMAHNIKPVPIFSNNIQLGEYQFEIELEMRGRWMFEYNFSNPKKNRVFEKLDF